MSKLSIRFVKSGLGFCKTLKNGKGGSEDNITTNIDVGFKVKDLVSFTKATSAFTEHKELVISALGYSMVVASTKKLKRYVDEERYRIQSNLELESRLEKVVDGYFNDEKPHSTK